MKKAEIERLARNEESSFYLRGKRWVIEVFLKEAAKFLKAGSKILDVGCGPGGNLPLLSRWGKVLGIDSSPTAVRIARLKGWEVKNLGAEKISPKLGSFGLVTLLDVLEHLKDDQDILKRLGSVVCEDGLLLLSVPAHPWLWSPHDEALGHARRYRKKEIILKLQNAGFVPIRVTYWLSLLFLPACFYRILRKIRVGCSVEASADLTVVPLFNGVFTLVMRLEAFLLSRFDLPLGLSLIVLARKEKW